MQPVIGHGTNTNRQRVDQLGWSILKRIDASHFSVAPRVQASGQPKSFQPGRREKHSLCTAKHDLKWNDLSHNHVRELEEVEKTTRIADCLDKAGGIGSHNGLPGSVKIVVDVWPHGVGQTVQRYPSTGVGSIDCTELHELGVAEASARSGLSLVNGIPLPPIRRLPQRDCFRHRVDKLFI